MEKEINKFNQGGSDPREVASESVKLTLAESGFRNWINPHLVQEHVVEALTQLTVFQKDHLGFSKEYFNRVDREDFLSLALSRAVVILTLLKSSSQESSLSPCEVAFQTLEKILLEGESEHGHGWDAWRQQEIMRHVTKALGHLLAFQKIHLGFYKPKAGEDTPEQHLEYAIWRIAVTLVILKDPE